MTSIFFMQYELRPAPGNPLFAEVGGALTNCFVAAPSAQVAQTLALANFEDTGWAVVGLEEAPRPVVRESYADDPEWLEYFDTASQRGACYVHYEWPAEPQEGDAVH